MENPGKTDTPLIGVTFCLEHPLANHQVSTLIREVGWRFDLDADLLLFCEKFMRDELLGPVLEKWWGMRVSCACSLYELLIISIVLQNIVARRSIQMIEALFQGNGTKLQFDGKELDAFWEPERLYKATEKELRALKLVIGPNC